MRRGPGSDLEGNAGTGGLGIASAGFPAPFSCVLLAHSIAEGFGGWSQMRQRPRTGAVEGLSVVKQAACVEWEDVVFKDLEATQTGLPDISGGGAKVSLP